MIRYIKINQGEMKCGIIFEKNVIAIIPLLIFKAIAYKFTV